MPLLHNISELATCSPEFPQQDAAEKAIDCNGGLLAPGMIDCHTHLCFGGCLKAAYRADICLIDAPHLSHWLYHFRDNACLAVIKNGQWLNSR